MNILKEIIEWILALIKILLYIMLVVFIGGGFILILLKMALVATGY